MNKTKKMLAANDKLIKVMYNLFFFINILFKSQTTIISERWRS